MNLDHTINTVYELDMAILEYYDEVLRELLYYEDDEDDEDDEDYLIASIARECFEDEKSPGEISKTIVEYVFNGFGWDFASSWRAKKITISSFVMCKIIQWVFRYHLTNFGDTPTTKQINEYDILNLYALGYMKQEFNYRDAAYPDRKHIKRIRTLTYVLTAEVKQYRNKNKENKIIKWSKLIEVKSLINKLFGNGLISDLIIEFVKKST